MKCSGILVLGIVAVASLVLLSSCASRQDGEQGLATGQESAGLGEEESLESLGRIVTEGRTTGPMVPVYFAYDSASIATDQVARIQVNAAFLTEQQALRVRIEGNCDSRGTREYNLALGEKRALSVKKYLVNLGISSQRISTVSMGEEKLLIYGHDEMAWAQNRRGDFVIEPE